MSAHSLAEALRAAVGPGVEVYEGVAAVYVFHGKRHLVWSLCGQGWECGDVLVSEDHAVRATLRWLAHDDALELELRRIAQATQAAERVVLDVRATLRGREGTWAWEIHEGGEVVAHGCATTLEEAREDLRRALTEVRT